MAKLCRLRCGGCGGETVKLEGELTSHGERFRRIVATCSGCDSRTAIQLTATPTLTLEWGREDQAGVLCVMPGDAG